MAANWYVAEERREGRPGYAVTVRAAVGDSLVTVSAWSPSVANAIDMAGECAAERMAGGDVDAPIYTAPDAVEGPRAELLADVALARRHRAHFTRLLEREPAGPNASMLRAAIEALDYVVSETGRAIVAMETR